MFIITGIGRSGTSFISEIFHNMGYKMGEYNKAIDAGYEDYNVTAINKAIMSCENVNTDNYKCLMVECAKNTKVAKDPRFLLTIGHWVRAGAQIQAVFFCTRNINDVIWSSEEHSAGNLSILHRFDDATKVKFAITLERGFWYLCGIAHIPVFEIMFPQSLTDFEQVRCLNAVDNNLETLRETWEKTRRIPQ